MSIIIDKDRCTSCNQCLDICPGNLIYKRKDGKAFIKYPKDCWGCTACMKECKYSAISYIISPQIGGSGGKMNVKESNNFLIWTIQKEDFKNIEIKIDRAQSNRY